MSSFTEPTIKIQGLTKEYFKKKVVDNINLEISNSCFALLGPNGAGKTTTMLMLLRLVKPSSGTAFILGADIKKNMGDIRRKIGYLPENIGFHSRITGRSFLELVLSLRNKARTKDGDVESYLHWCGLEERDWDKNVKTYSRGMKQRLGIAQAFIGNPLILFLDEPLSNIDPMGREELIKKIREKRREGNTVIISSHIILEIEQLADTLAFIDKGKIVASGKIYDLARSYGLNEFEISRIGYEKDVSIDALKDEISAEKDLISGSPTLLSEKIIFKTENPRKVAKITWKYEDYNFTPISGALNKLYKKIIGK